MSRAYQQQAEAERRDAWERMRMGAFIAVQPHLSRRTTPQKLLPLPWDSRRSRGKKKAPGQTPEACRRRFEELAARLGCEIME